MSRNRVAGADWISRELARDQQATIKEANRWLRAVAQVVAALARTSKTVVVPGLGSFKVVTHKARRSNLRRGTSNEMGDVPAKWRVKFTPARENRGDL